MKQGLFEIMENRPLTSDVMRIRLKGDCSAIKKPGQFVDIKIEGLFLRRPLSVCDCEDGVITLVYKVLGSGTEKLSKIQSGSLDLLTGATSLVDNAGSLATGLSELLLVLLEGALGLDLGSLSLVEVVLDGLLTLVEHADNHRPSKLGKNHPDNQEGNEGRNELRHVGNQDADTQIRVFLCKSERGGSQGNGTRSDSCSTVFAIAH